MASRCEPGSEAYCDRRKFLSTPRLRTVGSVFTGLCVAYAPNCRRHICGTSNPTFPRSRQVGSDDQHHEADRGGAARFVGLAARHRVRRPGGRRSRQVVGELLDGPTCARCCRALRRLAVPTEAREFLTLEDHCSVRD
jgi:hypothetical protein